MRWGQSDPPLLENGIARWQREVAHGGDEADENSWEELHEWVTLVSIPVDSQIKGSHCEDGDRDPDEGSKEADSEPDLI